MSKGFLVKCQECQNEVVLTSKVDNYMGYNGSDIYSSKTALIYFTKDRDAAGVVCKCGNTIIDC